MSLSASTCLTYTGTTPLGQTLYVFSNVDAYSSYFTTIPLSAITGNNCPYLITGIPDGTTSIRLQDYATGCCVTIPIQCSDFCNTCDLDFTLLSASTVSQIVAGNLTGSCENITDYVIYWYGPNSTTEVGYTSGFGTGFTYQFEHPLTGDSAIFAQGGTYLPVIDKVKISGYTFSQTGGTGYIANLNCFSPITVESLKCNNGNTVGNFSHEYAFDNAGFGVLPQPLSASFELSSNTAFFAYKFKAETVIDQLDITLHSVNYPVPIVLESILVGQSPSGNFTTFPRAVGNTQFFGRILTLTAFTLNTGDYLELNITPSTANTQTNWSFGCECLPEFDCSDCTIDSNKNNPYPIILSTVTAITANCELVQVSLSVSGCPSSASTSDLRTYTSFNPSSWEGATTNGIININYNNLTWTAVTCNSGGGYGGPTCRTPNSNQITYEKGIFGGIGEFRITCDTFADLNDFYSEYQTSYTSYSGSPFDNTSVDYYRAFTLFIPTPLTNSCGDGTTFNAFPIHYSSVVTTGGTGPWFINFTMPTITPNITFTECDINCSSSLNAVVSSINNASTGTSNNFTGTTTTGSKYINGTFIQEGYRILSVTNTVTTASTRSAFTRLYNYQYQTVPWSGVSNTLIPSLSGQSCSITGITPHPSNQYFEKYNYLYQVQLTDPLDRTSFNIYGSQINNGVYSGYPYSAIYELAVSVVSNTVVYSNPYYTI